MNKIHQSDPSRRGAAPGVLIWIVGLVVAFLVSLTVAIISSGDAEAALAERDQMRSDRDAAVARLEVELDAVTELSKVLGFFDEDSAARRSETETANEALTTFKNGFNDMGATVTTFEQAAELAVPEFNAKVVQIRELNSRIADLQTQVATKTTQMNTLGSEKDTLIADLRSQLNDSEQSASDRQSDLEGQISSVRTSLTDRESALRKVRTDMESENRTHGQEKAAMQTRFDEMGRKLAFLKEPEAKDGEVLAVNAELGLAWINIGQKNRLLRGTRFRIVDGTPGDGRLKAWCSVTRVEEGMAEVLLSDQADPFDPPVAGDIIYNPIYDPNSQRNAALVGRFSGTWNEKELRLLLEEVGIHIQDGVDKTTDYLIVGSEIYTDDDGEPLEEPSSPSEEPEYSNAVAMGVQIVPIKQIREYFLRN
jgi:predicted  nucleic acid-binding Zn-ribbon protein